MKKLILLAIIGLCALSTFAQRDNEKWYLNGFGGRLEVGASSNQLMGLDIDHFFRVKFDAGLMFLTNFDNIYQGAIYGKYVAAFPNLGSRLRWYAGGGILCGGKPQFDKNGDTDGKQIYAGPIALLGIGYSPRKIPVNFGVEWRPCWNVIYTHFQKNNANNERLQTAIIAFTARFITGNRY